VTMTEHPSGAPSALIDDDRAAIAALLQDR
jgi:hypothetical protein